MVSLLVFFFKVTLNMVVGYYAHYATFMASRAYLVADTNQNAPEDDDMSAEGLSRAVFGDLGQHYGLGKQRLRFNSPSQVSGSAQRAVYVGVWYEFSPPYGMGVLKQGDAPTFRSESFLGREPTKSDVYNQMCQLMGAKIGAGSCPPKSTVCDNGC